MKKVSKVSLAIAVSAIAMGASSALAQDAPTVAQEPAGDASETAEDDQSEGEIVVTGVRRSLSDAIDLKRQAPNFVDAISAQDIGKLPDTNIAESVQRITGVQVNRDAGEGRGVNVRGLNANTLINGRVAASTGQLGQVTRDFDFRSLAADFFQTVEVSKSPTASLPEGALGGTINLITRKPLDFRDPVISLGLEGTYASLAREFDPRASLFVTDRLFGESVGFALSLSYARRQLRQDSFFNNGGLAIGTAATDTGFDFDQNGVANNFLRPNDFRFVTQNDTRTRYGADLTLQWRPSDKLDIRLDGTATRFENVIRDNVFRTLAGVGSTGGVTNVLNPVISSNGILTSGTFTGQNAQPDGRYQPDISTTVTGGLNATWTSGPWKVEGDISYSKATSEFESFFLRFQSLASIPVNVTYQSNGNAAPPNLILTDGQGQSLDLLRSSLYAPNLSFDRVIESDQDELVGRLDLSYDVSSSWLSTIKLGGRITTRNIAFRVAQSASQSGNNANPAFRGPGGVALTAADAPLSQFVTTNFPSAGGVFSGFAGNFPRQWLVGAFPGGSARGEFFVDALNLRDFGGLVNSNQQQSDIEESTYAAYAEAGLDGEIGSLPLTGSLGLRFVRTDLVSEGLLTLPSGVQPVRIDNSYSNWLPSLNLRLEAMPDLYIRFAAAKVIQRPDLNDLRTGFNINQSSGTATGGNPELRPFRSTQADLGIEWYFGRESLLSVTGFYKDVTDFTVLRTEVGQIPGVTQFNGDPNFLITRRVNDTGAKIKGFEIGFQQPFTWLPGALQGLGIVANYTFSDVETESGAPYEGLSRHTYNLIGYYEREGVSARVAYNYRSRFASTGLATGGNALVGRGIDQFVAGFGVLDASVSFDITDNIKLIAEGANLLDFKTVRFQETRDAINELYVTDRRFTLGVKATF